MKNLKIIKYITYIVLFSWVSILLLSLNNFTQMNYISSEYSKYCYLKGEENKNIKTKVHYKTLEECGKPLKT